ncbi:MAG: transporter substrate-binding domain-containing protein [Acetobacteraceae bacterium]
MEFTKVTSVSRVPLLLSGNIDLVAASMTHTRERERTIDFSLTYYTGGQSLLVPKDSPIAGVGDLASKRVVCSRGRRWRRRSRAWLPPRMSPRSATMTRPGLRSRRAARTR